MSQGPTAPPPIPGLVVHLPFNNALTDVTGRGNNAVGIHKILDLGSVTTTNPVAPQATYDATKLCYVDGPGGSLARDGGPAAIVLAIGAALLLATLDAMQARRGTPGAAFDFAAALRRLYPVDVNGWLQVLGIAAFAAVGGMLVAAMQARRMEP